jgi:apolipoprotein N-acyltransferase
MEDIIIIGPYHRLTEQQITNWCRRAIAIDRITGHWAAVLKEGMQSLILSLDRRAKWAVFFGGALSATGFAPLNLWPLALLGFATLIYFVSRAPSKKQAFITGWIFGISHFAVSNIWIAVAFNFQAEMPMWLGYVAVIALALYLAVFPALASLGAWIVGDSVRKGGNNATIPYALAFSASWIVTEWLRSGLFTGYSWNPLSAIAIDLFPAGSMRLIGTYGLSGLVLLFSAILLGLLGGLFARQWKPVFARMLDTAILCAICGILSWAGSGNEVISKSAPYPITITQPNISQIEKYDPGYEDINFARLAANSRPLKGQGPRLLLWPEAAVPYYLESGYPLRYYQFQPGESAIGARMALAELMGKDDILITGVDNLEFNDDRQLIGARNSMVAMNANTDIIGTYDKSHLVPYGEYLPMPQLLEFIGLARLVPGDVSFWPGPGPRTLNLGPSKPQIGFQICYEIIFSGQTVDRKHRPDFILNSSNDAWFGKIGPPQFVVQARLRALEEGLPVIRATPTGISAIIDANGNIMRSLPMGIAGRIDDTLPRAHQPTFFAQHGNVIPLIFAAILMLFAFLPVVMRRALR